MAFNTINKWYIVKTKTKDSMAPTDDETSVL